MLFASIFDSEPPPWEWWVIPAAGLFATLLTLLLGRHLLARSRSAAGPAPVAAAPAPVHDPFAGGSLTERRIAVRRKGNPLEVLITDAEATQEPFRGWVIDRSMGGLCLLLHEPVEEGLVVSVKPRQSPPGMPWLQATVRKCKQEKTGYEVGCQFVKTPPFGVLLLFG